MRILLYSDLIGNSSLVVTYCFVIVYVKYEIVCIKEFSLEKMEA